MITAQETLMMCASTINAALEQQDNPAGFWLEMFMAMRDYCDQSLGTEASDRVTGAFAGILIDLK